MKQKLTELLESKPHSAEEEAILTEIAREDFADISLPQELTDSVFGEIAGLPRRKTAFFRSTVPILIVLSFITTAGFIASKTGLFETSGGSPASETSVLVSDISESETKNIFAAGNTGRNSESIDVGADESADKEALLNATANTRKSNSELLSDKRHESSRKISESNSAASVSQANNSDISRNEQTNSSVSFSSAAKDKSLRIFSVLPVSETLAKLVELLPANNRDKSVPESSRPLFPRDKKDRIFFESPEITGDNCLPFIDNTAYRLHFGYSAFGNNSGPSDIPFENAVYSGSSISGSYRLYAEHEPGFEIGFDNFIQSFSINSGSVDYKQSPVLFYYGATWKYTPQFLEYRGRIYPYARVFAGGTGSGPLLKIGAGTDLRLFGNVYISGGIEYGSLFYNVENIIYNSSKFRGTVGLQIRY